MAPKKVGSDEADPPGRALVSIPMEGGELSESELLLHVLERHVRSEEESMAAYRQIGSVGDPVVAMLMELVIEDELKHHDLLQRMALRLRNDIELASSPDALNASPAHPHGMAEVVAVVRHYVKDEREGARIMKRLARDNDGLYGGVFSLLLEVMVRDSEKHEAILRFILRRLDEPDEAAVT